MLGQTGGNSVIEGLQWKLPARGIWLTACLGLVLMATQPSVSAAAEAVAPQHPLRRIR
jgi:hypothetical protein